MFAYSKNLKIIFFIQFLPAFNKSFYPSLSRTNFISMAWMCTGNTHAELCKNLREQGIIESQNVYEALLKVDRSNYVESKDTAYYDSPSPIGHGQTISAPHMHAHALQLIHDILKPGARVLDVGSGSGYLTACMGRMVEGNNGHVFGIETIQYLVKHSLENINKADSDLLKSGTVSIQQGDGWEGLPSEAPFDAIHVGAAAEIVPKALLKQLNPHGGRMIIPVGPSDGDQCLVSVTRNGDQYSQKDLMGVRFVPLVRKKNV